MSANKSLFTGLLFCSVLLLSFSSCKKCVVPETDTNTGEIQNDVILYTKSGNFASNMGGNYLVTGSSIHADRFEVSFNGGVTKQDINWNNYNVVGYPVEVNCKASFTRNVSLNTVCDRELRALSNVFFPRSFDDAITKRYDHFKIVFTNSSNSRFPFKLFRFKKRHVSGIILSGLRCPRCPP